MNKMLRFYISDSNLVMCYEKKDKKKNEFIPI